MITISRWKCGAAGCQAIAWGFGHVVGLRALGWEVIIARDKEHFIRCPLHYGEGSGFDRITMMKRALAWARTYQMTLATIAERPALRDRVPKFCPWRPELL